MKINILYLNIFLILMTCVANASTDEEFRFKRCFAQFTRTKISQDHSLLQKVKANEITGSQACRQLLEQASFNKNGIIKNENTESLNTLHTFQSLNRSFFKIFELFLINNDYSISEVYDINEMAYHYTYSLFTKDFPLLNVLTSPYSFQAIRKKNQEPLYFIDNYAGEPILLTHKWNLGKDTNDWTVSRIAIGTLVGIEKKISGKTFFNFKSKTSAPPWKVDIGQDLGGGLIGTPTYVLLNAGHVHNFMDGGNRVYRRWSKSVLNDLLCRNLPVIREEDALPQVRKNSEKNFQRDVKCMHCHSTMDPMAGVLRNAELWYAPFNGNVYNDMRGIGMHTPDPKSDKYWLQPPKGNILFRNYEDKLINADFNNINDLGKWIIEQDDFYLCTAKRYVAFLTGKDVTIDTDFKSKATAKSDHLNIEKFVLEQSLNLKKHQSLAQLIEEIIASPLYLNRL